MPSPGPGLALGSPRPPRHLGIPLSVCLCAAHVLPVPVLLGFQLLISPFGLFMPGNDLVSPPSSQLDCAQPPLTPEDCATACLAEAQCAAFLWLPLNSNSSLSACPAATSECRLKAALSPFVLSIDETVEYVGTAGLIGGNRTGKSKVDLLSEHRGLNRCLRNKAPASHP